MLDNYKQLNGYGLWDNAFKRSEFNNYRYPNENDRNNISLLDNKSIYS